MNKLRKSHYKVNDPVILTHNCKGYIEGKFFVVIDPYKYGKENEIKLHDNELNKNVQIPSKYLDDIK